MSTHVSSAPGGVGIPVCHALQPTLQSCRPTCQNRRTFIGRRAAWTSTSRRMYLKEEEFLEEYLGTVEAAVDLLRLDWQPNYSCNDYTRNDVARRIRNGMVNKLTFQDAVIFHGRAGFSSIRVYLRSSTRFTVIRIH